MKCRSCGWEHTDESKSCAACGAPSMAWLAKHDRLRGRVIDAKYAIVDVLHEGADGRLYHGEFIATGEPVTILALHPHVMHRGSAADFTRLFASASEIRNDGVVRVLDHGQIDDGPLYLVMEPVCLSRPFWTDDDVVPSFERGAVRSRGRRVADDGSFTRSAMRRPRPSQRVLGRITSAHTVQEGHPAEPIAGPCRPIGEARCGREPPPRFTDRHPAAAGVVGVRTMPARLRNEARRNLASS